ncbi:MAG: ABC transporter ATP-binding protein [Pleurocapsa minor GSE-CHR-MK-17-07R]|jgi:putative ABC transport system ATP-binding protein|nr:ABC transporter ATP-binding protein [Pleurocapsa minor GSE-CHR-MK 17-07R]
MSTHPPLHAIVEIRELTRQYAEGGATRLILDHVNLDIEEGEFFVLLGKSGSGKSTLLNLISGIDSADSGSIRIDGTDITKLNDRGLTLFRRDHIGIIFQFFNLIPTLTVLENVTLPVELAGGSVSKAQKRGRELLERVGLANRADSFPDKLSGGEQQRIAIARALVTDPAFVLADEPTGNLDEETGERVLKLLLELTRDAGKTLVMATHNPDIVPFADRVCRIHEGKLVVSSPVAIKEPIL